MWDVYHESTLKRDVALKFPVAPCRGLGLGLGVWGLGFGIWGLGFGVWGLGFGVWESTFVKQF